jgi:hypothetical protein
MINKNRIELGISLRDREHGKGKTRKKNMIAYACSKAGCPMCSLLPAYTIVNRRIDYPVEKDTGFRMGVCYKCGSNQMIDARGLCCSCSLNYQKEK